MIFILRQLQLLTYVCEAQQRCFETAETSQEPMEEAQYELGAQEDSDVSTEQRIRKLRITNTLQNPMTEVHANSRDLDPTTTQRATDDGDESQDKDELSMSSMYLRQSRALSKAGKVRKSKKSHPSPRTFLDESDTFDYGEFDIMDRQRPSIQPRPKRRNRHLTLESTDSVFEDSMQLTWEADRAKKKLRKQAREDLRQLGLLEKKGKASLKSRCVQGLSLVDVEEQLRIFLQSPQER